MARYGLQDGEDGHGLLECLTAHHVEIAVAIDLRRWRLFFFVVVRNCVIFRRVTS